MHKSTTQVWFDTVEIDVEDDWMKKWGETTHTMYELYSHNVLSKLKDREWRFCSC